MSKVESLIRYSGVALISSIFSCYFYDANLKRPFVVKSATLVQDNTQFMPNLARKYLDLGIPEDNKLRVFEGFVAYYDKKHRIPSWVIEHLPSAQIKSSNNEKIGREGHEFYEDLSEDPLFRSRNSDYFRSGYDRGHMAAAGNHRFTNKNQYNQTFILANIAPQVGDGFNRHVWNQLERYVRNMAYHSHDLYAMTGSLFIPHNVNSKKYVTYEVIGDNNVSVPTHFYKVVAFRKEATSKWELVAWLLPNIDISKEKIDLSQYQVPLSKIEQYAGYRVFPGIR